MLKHSKTSSAYLKRRQRLFQAYGNYSNTPQATHSDTDSNTQLTINPLSWVIHLAQILENVPIRIQQIKTFISNSPEDMINRCFSNVAELIEISISFNRASKISNTLYFLCKKSFPFKIQLQKFLDKKYEKLISGSVQLANIYYQNLAIILTDMYLFGLYFTSDQMFNIINVILAVQQQEINLQDQKMEKSNFQLQYAANFLQLFLSPFFMPRRFSEKILQLLEELISKKSYPFLKKSRQKMQMKLKALQEYYSCLPDTNDKPEQLDQRKYKQLSFLSDVHRYENFRRFILKILKTIDTVLHFAFLESNQLSILNAEIQKMPIVINDELKQQDQDFTSQQADGDLQKGSPRTKQSKNESSHVNSDEGNSDKQEMLLKSIYLNCKYFKNSSLFYRQQIYCVEEDIQSGRTFDKDTSFCILESLPQTYIESLQNCTDIQSATMLANRFLLQFNKHSNREILVKQIFNRLFDRNNITYILKSLKIISLKEEIQIQDLINQSVEEINSKASASGRIGKGIYGKYSNLCIQLAKFGLLNILQYLLGLLDEIKKLNGMTQTGEEKSLGQRSPTKATQMIGFGQIVSIIERIGYYGYYHSLEAHIIFNEIINNLYHHIKTKAICYDVQTVNQFNGLISYLRNVRVSRQSSQIQKITAVQLKDKKKFWGIVKRIQCKIKQESRKNIQEICSLIENSISSQNYILSFLYADLIYEVNSKILDLAIISFTKNKIINLLANQNYQSSANWARFLGQLLKYKIFKQPQFFQFLGQLLHKWYSFCDGPSIKVLASALQGCASFLKQTDKLSQYNQTLKFLLSLKSKLLAHRGLKNSILQFEIQEVLQYFHEAFKQIKSVDDCRYLQKLIEAKKKQCNIEKILSDYELIALSQEIDKQAKSKEAAIKFVEKRRSSKQAVSQQFQQLQQKNFQQLYRDASIDTDQALVLEKKEQPVETQGQNKIGKKIKVIGRSRNTNKIGKVEVTN